MSKPQQRVRAAIVGAGVIGPTHAKALALDARAELVLACDPDLEKAKRLGAAKASADWRDALGAGIDLVIVATPHQLHAEQTVAALEAKKHVICEKPLGTTPADVARMIVAAEKSGTVASGIFQHRYQPLARRLVELLRGGDFGAVEQATMDFKCTRTEAYYASGPWRGKWAAEGGALMINQAIHTLDLMNWFCGAKPVSVAGRVERRRSPTIECEDFGEATVTYAPTAGSGGATAKFRCENDLKTDWAMSIQVKCRFGGFTLGDNHRLKAVEHPNEALIAELRAADATHLDGVKLPGKDCYGDHHALQVQDVISAIIAGRRPHVTLADAAMTNQVVLGLYTSSAAGGKVVTLPAADFKRPTLSLQQAAAAG
jgi:predicted dehydrogenase